jgi:hypothetical protein
MRRAAAVLWMLVTAVTTASAQDGSSRAWQQRLQVEIPLPVPTIALESANPFASVVDGPPRLLMSTAPRKLEVSGRAVVAAYVDAKGDCLGAVPIELPFPGLTSVLVEEFTRNRFEPARGGAVAKPSWSVIQIVVNGKVKESEVVDSGLELPDPGAPPEASAPARVAPSGNLMNLPATAAEELTSLASPRRLKVKVPGRDSEFRLRALVHITADGRCDRFVPLELDAGFERWLSAYLASWRAEPATRDGLPVDAWAVYQARVQVKLSGLESTTFRVLTDRTYEPNKDAG